MTHEEELRINGSGLFFFKTQLSEKQQLDILNWYESLNEQEKEFVMILRSEKEEDALFFSQED